MQKCMAPEPHTCIQWHQNNNKLPNDANAEHGSLHQALLDGVDAGLVHNQSVKAINVLVQGVQQLVVGVHLWVPLALLGHVLS